VKTLCADASVDFVDVKVGHCQALNLMKMKTPVSESWRGFFICSIGGAPLHLVDLVRIKESDINSAFHLAVRRKPRRLRTAGHAQPKTRRCPQRCPVLQAGRNWHPG
jgi:hypothetical protein